MSLSKSLEDVKLVDQKYKDCISGYVRQAQQTLLPDNVYFTIPALVIHWILLYFWQCDCFDSKYVGPNYQLSDNDMVISKTNGGDGSVYLRNVVDAGVHKWKFKLRNKDGPFSMTIAVWKALEPPATNSCLYDAYYGSSGCPYGWVLNGEYRIGDFGGIEDFKAPSIKTGDIIEMILNLDELTLSYSYNGEYLGVTHENIEQTSYRAAVSFFDKDCIELLSYEA